MSHRIIWIPSYPKSGNTWLRFLLSNYFFNKEKIFDFKIIKNIKNFPKEDDLKKLIKNKSEILKNPLLISKYWIEAQKNLKTIGGNVVFFKTHNALVTINKNSFTNLKYSLAAIHIVRDPRDIVVSYSHHMNKTFDETIDFMIKNELQYRIKETTGIPEIEIMGSWKFNFLSWKNGLPQIPKLLVKYEDLLDNTNNEVEKIIIFLSKILNFKPNKEQIKFSVKNSTFKILQDNENNQKFDEASGDKVFFRKGEKNQWKSYLDSNQIKKIEKNFYNEMKSLGYL